MAEKQKIDTFIGFAVKARKIIYGINQIEQYRKKMHLLIVCESASDNTKKQAVNFAATRGFKLISLQGKTLEQVIYKENCKMVAITDFNLANAILDCGEEFFTRLDVRRES